MWDLLEFFLISSGEEINPKVQKALLELPEDYTVPKLKDETRIQVDTTGIPHSIRKLLGTDKTHLGALKFDNQSELKLLIDHLKTIQDFEKDARKYISDYTLPLPDHPSGYGYCLCKECVREGGEQELRALYIRATILDDQWFENHENTRERAEISKFVYYTWIVQMAYRLLARRKQLFTPVPPKAFSREPLWTYPEEYIDNGFPVLANNKRIAEWNCDEINQALLQLMRARSHEGLLSFELDSSFQMFIEYKQALIDRLACLLFTQFPKQSESNFPTWFKVVSTISKEFVSKKEVTIGNEEELAKARQVQHYMSEAKRDLLQDMDKDEDYLTETQKKIVEVKLQSVKERCDAALIAYNEKKMEDLLLESDRIVNQIAYIEKDLYDFCDDYEEEDKNADEAFVSALRGDLKMINDTLAQLNALKLDTERENLKSNRALVQSILAGTEENELVCVTKKWILDHFLYCDFLSIWQIKYNRFQVRPFDKRKTLLESHIFTTLMYVINNNTDESMVSKGQKFVYARFFNTFFEREMYRIEYGAAVAFNAQEVGSYTRDNLVFLEDYPKSTVEMTNPKNHYFNKTFMFFANWWFEQIFPGINIANTIFIYDLELKYCTLNRPKIKHPCISFIGSEFIVIEGPEWETKDGWLNCTWCGEDFIKALTHWFHLFDLIGDWQLYDRVEKKMYDIKHTDLHECMLEFYERNQNNPVVMHT